jgi:hypothetical protein
MRALHAPTHGRNDNAESVFVLRRRCWRAACGFCRRPRGRALHFRACAQEHQQSVLRPGFGWLQKSGAELKGAIKCLYIGPGEHGGGGEQAQIVGDLITKKVDGIAVSPANAAAIAAARQGAKAANIPIITWGLGSSRERQGPARDLYRHAQL